MSWVAINSQEGVSESFVTLPTIDQKRILPHGTLPINILNINDLNYTLNNVSELCFDNGTKKTLLIEGYYPHTFGIWATHKLYRITYQIEGSGEQYIVAKIMNKKYGEKEFKLLLDLSECLNVPTPFHFLYDEELAKEDFFDVRGILWMNYVENQIHFEEYLLNWCITGQKKLELKDLTKSLCALWSAGVKHNDLKGEHLLFTGDEWFIIDFEKSVPYSGKEDIKDELAVLIGDSTAYFDGFITYHKISFEGVIKERYLAFINEFLSCFDINLKGNRYISVFSSAIQNKVLKSIYLSLGVG